MQAKQHKGKFINDGGCRTKCHLEVVYSNVYGPMQVDPLSGNRYFATFIDDHSKKNYRNT